MVSRVALWSCVGRGAHGAGAIPTQVHCTYERFQSGIPGPLKGSSGVADCMEPVEEASVVGQDI